MLLRTSAQPAAAELEFLMEFLWNKHISKGKPPQNSAARRVWGAQDSPARPEPLLTRRGQEVLQEKFPSRNKIIPKYIFPPKEGRILMQNSQLSHLINPRTVPHSCPGIHHTKIFKWCKKKRGKEGLKINPFQGTAGFLKDQFLKNDNTKYSIKTIKLNWNY